MKTISKHMAVATLLGLTSVNCLAQGDDGPAGFTFAAYYVCDHATEGRMDAVVEANETAVLDRWVEEGKLLAWGYLSHYMGGRWRRAHYYVSATVEEALNNQSALYRAIYADNAEGLRARSEACAGHDDYIWALGQGSGPGTDRGNVSLSVYYVCKIRREDRADEIVAQAHAPKLNQMQKDGSISSWGWSSHRLGGAYRRLQTITGADHASVVAARAELLQHVNENHSEMGEEFVDICGSHTDYLWDIVHEAP